MTVGQTADLTERRAKVLAYFAEHPKATYRDAARDLGIPRSTVKRDHDAAIVDTIGRASDAYRATMIARNTAIVDAFLPIALIRGSVPHAQAILAADKRTADLLGLDAPKKIDVRQVVAETAERWGLTDDERTELHDRIAAHLAAEKGAPA